MRTSDGARPCQEARVYYYDLLGPEAEEVPSAVRQHVAACPFCREQIDRLREMLFEWERDSSSGRVPEDETVEALAEQFRLLDERVTCSDARACLPQLAMTVPQIRIPTPVTVHVDQCPQCAKDLAALRKLQLTTEQLRRLSQLFASAEGGPALSWPPAIPFGGRPESGPDEHDAAGPVVSGSPPTQGAVVVCREVSAVDIFNVVVPSGGPPGQRQKAIRAHVRTCPFCQERARKLHRTIQEIVARADSEIETVYHATEDTQDAATERPASYPYPVSVEVMHTGSGAACEPDRLRRTSRLWRHGLRGLASPLVRVAAVGVVVVALVTFVRTTAPTASGTSVGDVRRAIENAQDIQVVVTDQQANLVQEILIARRSGRLVRRTAQESTLYDLAHDLKQTIKPQAQIGRPTELSKLERAWARRAMANCLWDVLERVSPTTQLQPPGDDAGGQAGTNLNVYELQPSQQPENSLVRDRWWAYLDPATGLPQKTEFYRRGPAERQWRLVTTTIFTYPTEQEMEASLRTLLTAP